MRRLIIPALVAVLALAACGDDTASEPAADSASPSATAAAADVSAEAAAFCEPYNEVLAGGADPLGAADTPEAAADALREEAERIGTVVGDAPEELASDIETVAQVSTASLNSLADLLESEHGDVLLPLFKENRSPETIPDDAPAEEVAARDAAREWIGEAEARYTPEVLEASQRVGTWYTTACQPAAPPATGADGGATEPSDAPSSSEQGTTGSTSDDSAG